VICLAEKNKDKRYCIGLTIQEIFNQFSNLFQLKIITSAL